MAQGYEILGNDFTETERSILSEIHGVDKADEIIANTNGSDIELDKEVQEIIDDVLPLDELY